MRGKSVLRLRGRGHAVRLNQFRIKVNLYPRKATQLCNMIQHRHVTGVKVKSCRHVYLLYMRGDSDNPELKNTDYRDFISDEFMAHIQPEMHAVEGVSDLFQVGESGGLETGDSLRFLCELFDLVKSDLRAVLRQRVADREFIDQRTRACFELNRKLRVDYGDRDYQTIIGQEDADGRIVVGPKNEMYCKAGSGNPVAPIPEFLRGHHVTLFGPPDDAKLSINAMNAFHRKLPGEPAIVAELLRDFTGAPMWGADDEDSKTPLRADLVLAGQNLTNCFKKNISFTDQRTGKNYALESTHLSQPIKRFPGLAIPCAFLFYKQNPLPLHLYDFALHLFANWDNPKALVFYVPKLENEEEAAYIRVMIEHAERLIQRAHPHYQTGTIRLMIVLENPRAVFRVNEIMDALHPYFAGASLGWHDYLASTARLMKEDANYRIPVKADPNIVIKHIKASHDLLATVVGSRGGIKIGGMYGVLPFDSDMKSDSFQVAIKGFIKDVITQLKRDLNGFWVAHPDFVRLGLALVEAWKRFQNADHAALDNLVKALLLPKYHVDMLAFIHGADVAGLDPRDALYPRALLVADEKQSNFIANNDPREIRYNIFQSLQYLTDWLSGNGCVALPATIDGVPVRVMDDLATAERSRWEVWHELHHGRFDVEEFVRIAHEEMRFIQKDFSTADKITQVKWNERTRKWYPVAMNIMLQLMSNDKPVEFASELLLPFTLDCIRTQSDPWKTMAQIEPSKYQLPAHVARYHAYFSACGSHAFASAMSRKPVLDIRAAQQLIQSFSVADVLEAASFHGDIGESARTLDATAAAEQAKVLRTNSQAHGRDSIQIQPNDSAGPQQQNSNNTLEQLRLLGARYLEKFKFKFLISAQGKTGEEMLAALQARLDNSSEQELANAREALWQITHKRLCAQPIDSVVQDIQAALQRHTIVGASISVSAADGAVQSLQFGQRAAGQPVTPHTCFEIASLSKSIATCFAMEFFRAANIPLDTCVNALLSKTSSGIRVLSLNPKHPEWADQVTLTHLMSHEALNLHYVNGVPADQPMPSAKQLMVEHDQFHYEPSGVLNEPGSTFQYSGGGFIVLEHIIETLAAQDVAAHTDPFLRALHMNLFTFEQSNQANMEYASGFTDSGQEIEGARIMFPAFAAGAVAPAQDVAKFLRALTSAYHNLDGAGPISHDTAVRMLHGVDKGSQKFIGCNMGLGIFTADAGSNRLCIHQGANDGFRALFIHCYAGPDKGAGLVILANGEHNGVLFIAEAAQIVLRHFKMQGVDATRFQNQFVAEDIPQEQRVNAGYRELIFGAFQADLPEAITRRGLRDPLADFNLAVGARIEEVSNQRFARAENLLSPNQPTFEPALFGKQGKVMDSWESVRHNPREFDHLIFEMKHAAVIDCVTVSTQFHLGNHAPAIRVQGWDATHKCWKDIVARSPLAGHSFHAFNAVSQDALFTRIQVSMFPDGGVTRLALYGKNLPPHEKAKLLAQPCVTCPPFDAQTRKPLTPKYAPNSDAIKHNLARFAPGAATDVKVRVNQSLESNSAPLSAQSVNTSANKSIFVGAQSVNTGDTQYEMDLACAAFGATIVSASNQHYGPAAQVISPYPPLNMFDGLESARSRDAGHSENVVIALAKPARIGRVEIAFTYFVNNNPREITIEGLCNNKWVPLVKRTKVKAFAANSIQFAIHHPEVCEQIRVTAFPDGGMNRVRVFAAL